MTSLRKFHCLLFISVIYFQYEIRRIAIYTKGDFNMLEKLLSLPGFIYEINGKYYYLGKWICKPCTATDETDCHVMYQMCKDAGEKKETAFYFQKIRAYSDFALEIPYNPAQIRSSMTDLLNGLSEFEQEQLAGQISAFASFCAV